jgi:hypothetical protein
MGRRYSVGTDKLTATMEIANRIHSIAQEQSDPALMIGAYFALAGTLYYSGHFERATIRKPWHSDLACGRRSASDRRGSRLRRLLSVL